MHTARYIARDYPAEDTQFLSAVMAIRVGGCSRNELQVRDITPHLVRDTPKLPEFRATRLAGCSTSRNIGYIGNIMVVTDGCTPENPRYGA